MKFYVVALLLVHAFVCTMAVSNFLKSKWEDWYISVDVDHDGIVSTADLVKARRRFTKLNKDYTDKLKILLEKLEEWWNVYILKGHYYVSKEQFVDDLIEDYTRNKTGFHDKMQNCFKDIFDVLDINQDGSFSIAEHLISSQEYGHEDIMEGVKSFALYQPENGLVPLKDIVNSWVDLTTNDNSSKPSFLKDVLEARE